MEKGFKITILKAFIAEDKYGTEGIIAEFIPQSGWMPFVCADDARVESFIPRAKRIASERKLKVRLVQFSIREDLGEI